MTSRARIGRRLLVATLHLATACAAGGNAVPTIEAAIDPRDFYPFSPGNAWSYDVDAAEGSTILAVTVVDAFDGHVAEVRTGRAMVRYEVRADGIRIPSEDSWLVRAPLHEGATWPSRGGRTARLVSTGVDAETPAGRFGGCIEVLETGGQLDLEVATVYCPGVGPVFVRSTMRSKSSDRTITVSARLRGYEVNPSTVAYPR